MSITKAGDLELKEYYFIRDDGAIIRFSSLNNNLCTKSHEQIGNYFETREEAKKAQEKLKAWKRLKDKGFRFDGYHIPAGEIHFNMEIPREVMNEFVKDMNICFGGEE